MWGRLSGVATPTIRPATLSDEPALARINWRTWSPISEITPRPVPETPFFGESTRPEQCLIAEFDGQSVGYVRLVQPIPVASVAHVRQIQGLAVETHVRGRGIGGALLEAAVAETRRQGANRLTLRVLATNTNARRLYERMGFVVEGVLRGEFHIDGAYVDDILMARGV
ncbi:GNAT family N-acetyltransferase [Nocardia arthritidis]|uniref:GNAT family N-acetyltransferase n=1 Tax=Nocardia arthritidis TaxID=228602 RepID=A0A6G9Y866_9NOCA|nr:GNAT family N-acetyltransferase [Nocardia arthritidis]